MVFVYYPLLFEQAAALFSLSCKFSCFVSQYVSKLIVLCLREYTTFDSRIKNRIRCWLTQKFQVLEKKVSGVVIGYSIHFLREIFYVIHNGGRSRQRLLGCRS